MKSRHLRDAHVGGLQQPQMKSFGHNLEKAYNALPVAERILAPQELDLLRAASAIYDVPGKGFDYVTPADAATGFSQWPELPGLEVVARKLIESHPL
jgi:hypothetical protein